MTASTIAETTHSSEASPAPGLFDEVYVALKNHGDTDHVAVLSHCLEMARSIEKECHDAAMTAAIDVAVDYGVERERFETLLRVVTEYGEARMLARGLNSMREATFFAVQPEGEA